MINDKKFQKKVIKLITATRKCAVADLQLFMALIMIRFDWLDCKLQQDSTLFEETTQLYNVLKQDDNITNLLK